MGPTIYASFEDKHTAQTAVGALIHAGVPASDIAIACKADGQERQRQATDLNPAQDDYPRGDASTPTEFSSAPPNAQRDYNTGLEADDYNTDYKGDVDRDIRRDLDVDRQRANEFGPGTDKGVGPTTNEAYARQTDAVFETRGSEPPDSVEEDQEFGAMAGTFPDLRASGPGNSFGDPAMGGLGTRFAGIAATANGAANPGGMTDFLWNSLPTDMASFYQNAYDGGKAIVIVRASEEDVAMDAERVLHDEGGIQVHRHGYLA